MEKEENVMQKEIPMSEDTQAQTQKEEKTSVEKTSGTYGKFKDADALWKAYNSLQSEFTRRSQRLKELLDETEKNNQAVRKGPVTGTDGENSVSASTPLPADGEPSKREIGPEEKERIIAEYLQDIKKSAVPVTKGGVGVVTPRIEPHSIADAGKLALEYLKR